MVILKKSEQLRILKNVLDTAEVVLARVNTMKTISKENLSSQISICFSKINDSLPNFEDDMKKELNSLAKSMYKENWPEAKQKYTILRNKQLKSQLY